MKKVITAIITLCMTLGMLGGAVMAEQTPAQENVELIVFAAASMTETLEEIA